jgi:hypothetical protein
MPFDSMLISRKGEKGGGEQDRGQAQPAETAFG